jgi:hypothetical protein
MPPTPELLAYYAAFGPMTGPGEQGDLLAGLPGDLAALCQVVQNNLIHIFWAERYGRSLSEADKGTVGVRRLADKLARMRRPLDRPLVEPRPLALRQVGNCRDFSLLLAALLQAQGTPARPRCGFGAYFTPEHYEDHWVCEYWQAARQRWVLVDAQLDALQCEVLNPPFGPLDVPRDQFITGGKAWQMCRQGLARPEQFGIFDMNGWWFIWGNVARDFLALNKIEILPWDYELGAFTHPLEDPFPQDTQEIAFYDQIAALAEAGDGAFADQRQAYETDPRWRVPAAWLGPQPAILA